MERSPRVVALSVVFQGLIYDELLDVFAKTFTTDDDHVFDF